MLLFFFKRMPARIYLFKNETICGHKPMMNHITVMLRAKVSLDLKLNSFVYTGRSSFET